jgi:hypothetical protein
VLLTFGTAPQVNLFRQSLGAFCARLPDATALDALHDDLVGVVGETMQPEHVSVWLRPETTPKGEQVD